MYMCIYMYVIILECVLSRMDDTLSFVAQQDRGGACRNSCVLLHVLLAKALASLVSGHLFPKLQLVRMHSVHM